MFDRMVCLTQKHAEDVTVMPPVVEQKSAESEHIFEGYRRWGYLAADLDPLGFLAPVEPGNLLLMGYKDDVPIMSAPGCFRSLKPNVIDLMLPPMLARYRVSKWEVACLGHGGLLN